MTVPDAPPAVSAYHGRFAPSPTGPLHFGSLVAATGSFLEARTARGRWLVRMEDLDRPRNQPGAAAHIRATLDALGFEWDGEVMCQSMRTDVYRAALARLRAKGLVYPCGCSRREIQDSALVAPDGSLVYPGTCRDGLPPGRVARAQRLRVPDETIAFDDLIQGRIEQSLAREVGDFVLLRADGIHAYQLAVVVDDAEQGITDVVRGADLLDSTARQIYIQRALGLPTPRYAHLPVAVNAEGEKLSKQTLAAPLDAAHAAPAVVSALDFLGQSAPPALARASVRTVWQWALENWDRRKIPRARTRPAPAAMAA